MPTETNQRSNGDIILRTDRLTRIVDEKTLIHGVSMDVQRGSVVAIVGPSGSGKTSLLRLLNRLDEPTSGIVWLDDVDYRTIPPQELRRRVGMVMQLPYLFQGTVSDNICFGPRQRGEELTSLSVEQLLKQVGLADYAGRDVSNLSGGEAQRISLARTLANSPEVLLLDEPTSALDKDSQRGVEKLICRIIREQHLTCLIVTHDIDQAARMADQVMVVEAGQLAQYGPVKEVLNAQSAIR